MRQSPKHSVVTVIAIDTAFPDRSSFSHLCLFSPAVACNSTGNDVKCAMHHAPDNELPAGAMPDPAYKKDNQEIHIHPESTLPVSTKRNIHIFCQEIRQCLMPALPKIHDIHCFIRRIKVQRQVIAEECRNAHGNVTVTAEIKV